MASAAFIVDTNTPITNTVTMNRAYMLLHTELPLTRVCELVFYKPAEHSMRVLYVDAYCVGGLCTHVHA